MTRNESYMSQNDYGADHLHTTTCVQKFLILQMMAISLFLLWKYSF